MEECVMPKSDDQKQKILYIKDYLERYSSAEHPVKAAELIEMLEKHNIKCDRKTVYSDIKALMDYGLDIENRPGRGGGYVMLDYRFDISQLKLLVNAVQSSKFLTERKANEMITKLCEMCNEQDAKLIRKDIIVSGRVRSMNESILRNVDVIQQAIDANVQIKFQYFDWNLDHERVYRDRSYVASPYGLVQENENCYLLAHSERHGKTIYRVDRMDKITLSKEKRVACPELSGKNLYKTSSQMFQMYSGKPASVKMRFHRKLINAVVDRFGKDVMLVPDGEEHFTFTADVAVSNQFLGWVISFGTDAQILYPQSVADECKALAKSVWEQYG